MEDLKHLGSCKYNENSPSEPKRLHSFGIEKNVYGFPFDKSNKEYTVLLVGATKCGKSTIIDFIANFFMGISLPKNGVIHVTKDNIDKDAFFSYTFCTNDNKIFTFIDSPSINNDKGFVDKKRKQNFLNYITKMKENGIKINVLGVVIQNHFVRLAPAEEGMLRFVTSLIEGKNIAHIIPFITYADANTPPVLDALRTFGIDTDKRLIFNNVCLNPSVKKITNLSEMYWENGLGDIQKGLDIAMKLQPIDFSDIPQEDIETINHKEQFTENSKRSSEGHLGGSKDKFNTFSGRRKVSSSNTDSANVFSSLGRERRKNKKAKEGITETTQSTAIAKKRISYKKDCIIL